MNKKLTSLMALSVLAFSGCDNYDNKEPLIEGTDNQGGFEIDHTPGTVIGLEFQGKAYASFQRIYYLIDTDKDKSTAEYVGFVASALGSTQDVGQAFNAKNTKMTKPISQWSKVLLDFQRIQKENTK